MATITTRDGTELYYKDLGSGQPIVLSDGWPSIKATIDCVKAFSAAYFRPDMAKVDVPTLVIHGDDGQVVPLERTGKLAAEMVPGAQLKVYAGAPHPPALTHKDPVNSDLFDFLKQ